MKPGLPDKNDMCVHAPIHRKGFWPARSDNLFRHRIDTRSLRERCKTVL